MTALNLNAFTAFTPSTSGSYTFSCARDQVIRQAMLDIGALDPHEYPTSLEIADCAFKLNMMVKQWMGNTDFAPGLKVWTRKRAALFLQGNQFAYNLGQTGDNWIDSTTALPYPNLYGQTSLTTAAAQGATTLQVASTAALTLNDKIGIQVGGNIFWTTVSAFNASTGAVTIPSPGLSAQANPNAMVINYTNKGIRPVVLLTCTLRDFNNNDTPLRMMTLERYESLPSKVALSNIGDPTAVLYESAYKQQFPNGVLYLDVSGAQDVTKHLHCVYLAPTQDLVNPGDAVDYPQQWFRALVLGHGKDICGMFDCAWTPDLQDNYTEAMAIAKQADPAVTDVFFEVESDGPFQ